MRTSPAPAGPSFLPTPSPLSHRPATFSRASSSGPSASPAATKDGLTADQCNAAGRVHWAAVEHLPQQGQRPRLLPFGPSPSPRRSDTGRVCGAVAVGTGHRGARWRLETSARRKSLVICGRTAWTHLLDRDERLEGGLQRASALRGQCSHCRPQRAAQLGQQAGGAPQQHRRLVAVSCRVRRRSVGPHIAYLHAMPICMPASGTLQNPAQVRHLASGV